MAHIVGVLDQLTHKQDGEGLDEGEVEEEIVQQSGIGHIHTIDTLEPKKLSKNFKAYKGDEDEDSSESDEDELNEDIVDKEDGDQISSPEHLTHAQAQLGHHLDGQLLHHQMNHDSMPQQKFAQLAPTSHAHTIQGIPMLPPFPMLHHQSQGILQGPPGIQVLGPSQFQRSLTPQQLQILPLGSHVVPVGVHNVHNHNVHNVIHAHPGLGGLQGGMQVGTLHNGTVQQLSSIVIPAQVTEAQLLSPHEHTLHDEPDSPDDLKGSRKTRWRPTQEQRQTLESVWVNNPYPEAAVKNSLVKQFGTSVTYKQITSWFKHKRENEKNRSKFEYKYSPAMKFSAEQVIILEGVFSQEPYAKGKTLQDLATQLGVSMKRVQNWFKHKRSRLAQQGKFEYKPRNLLNSEQITFLKGAFFTNPTPTPELCEQLSSELNVKPEQVTRWFSNERSRKRKREEASKLGQMIDSVDAPDESEEDDLDDLGLKEHHHHHQVMTHEHKSQRKLKNSHGDELDAEVVPTAGISAQLLPLVQDQTHVHHQE
jgi:transcriptional regulator with XRE-family HTH domain